jgi:hypothetical protein
MTNCTTHHHACACREEMYQNVIRELLDTIDCACSYMKRMDHPMPRTAKALREEAENAAKKVS